MVKIIMGLIMIIGGLSGKLALVGTNSGGALAAVGIGLLVWGIYNLVNARQRN